MNITYNKEKNRHTCIICGREFSSYNAAYMHIKRVHENHPSVQTNGEGFANQNTPAASLFGNNQAVRYEPVYYEPVHHERHRKEEKEEKDNSGAILLFFLGLIAVGIWIYFRYFKGKFDFFGILANSEENDEVEPAFRVDNSMPVTKDGAYPVFEVRGEA
jgi:hypothetical protein